MRYARYLKKKAFQRVLEQERRDRWERVNSRFVRTDDPAGCKLSVTGCMERFVGPKEDMYVDKALSQARVAGSNREEWLEHERLNSIKPGMTLDEIDAILNPEGEI